MKKEQENEEIKQIKQDLLDQLLEQGKIGKHFESLVDDYINLEKLKRNIQKDINENGLRIKVMTGNGFKSEKPNESVQNILKVNGQQLKILQDLDLKTPSKPPQEGDGDDLL
jgi:phage terminase small subunit